MMKKFNTFHEVTKSPWPFLSSIQMYVLMTQMVINIGMKTKKNNNFTMLLSFLSIPMLWWMNTSMEANKEGSHNMKIINMMKLSMLMFIASEILFFTSFFWAYFHSSTSPNIEIGQKWPPMEIKFFNPINVPLLNTIILISSGFSITWSHHLMLEKNMKKAKTLLTVTCVLGVYFSILQWMEYKQAEFSLSDSTCGTTFFMATGFHGFHVLVGTTFLMVNLYMMNNMMISNSHHMAFELAAWYWHFVDIVWLMLYLSVYWWGK